MQDLYKPTARLSHLVIQQVSDELLVYDMAKHQAFCLNPTAAHVWQKCDGAATVADIADGLSRNETARDLVWLAIEQFADAGLLEGARPRCSDRRSRRHAIKALALTAMMTVPIVSTIATPKDNRGSMSVCVCTGSGDCARPGCPSPPNCGPVGICV